MSISRPTEGGAEAGESLDFEAREDAKKKAQRKQKRRLVRLWNLHDPLKNGGTLSAPDCSRGIRAEVSFPFIERFIPKAACFWTSECSAGVPPASVGLSMAGETPALQKSNRNSIFLQTLVSLGRGFHRAILADKEVALAVGVADLDEPWHLGGFIGTVGFFGKRGRKVVD